MGRRRFDRPYGTENELKYPFLPSDKSLGYCQPTLRVEILAASAAFKPRNAGSTPWRSVGRACCVAGVSSRCQRTDAHARASFQR